MPRQVIVTVADRGGVNVEFTGETEDGISHISKRELTRLLKAVPAAYRQEVRKYRRNQKIKLSEVKDVDQRSTGSERQIGSRTEDKAGESSSNSSSDSDRSSDSNSSARERIERARAISKIKRRTDVESRRVTAAS